MDKIILTYQQVEDLNIICYKLQKGSITLDKAVLKLRAGGFYDWAALAFIIYMFSLQQGNSFQNVPLPHQDPFGWLSGKYDSRNVGNGQCLSHPASRFERETLHMAKQMCHASANENGFVMSYDEAIKLFTIREIILAKNTIGNFFVDGFTLPLPQRQRDRITNEMRESNPGNESGGPSSAPSSGNLDVNWPSNPTLKFPY